MSVAVIDASALTTFYAADLPDREAFASRLQSADHLVAPAHLDVEVASALRGIARRSPAVATVVPAALGHLAGMPIRRMPLAPLLARIWELRENITAYDAAYVALAERVDAVLLTADRRLAAASGPRCPVEVVG